MTINQEDEAKLRTAIKKHFAAFEHQIYDDIHAAVITSSLNQEWQPVAANALEQNRTLRDRCDTLVGEMERIAAERDQLRNRVMELERQLQKPRQDPSEGPGTTEVQERDR